MIVPEIIERLLDQASPPFALVQGAAELASLGNAAPLAMPAAYIFISDEGSAENERVTGVLQRTEIDVTVIIVTGNVSDAQGAAAAGDLDTLKEAIRAALVGWQAASAEDVVTHVSGRLVRARDGLVWWEMILATAIYLESRS